MEFHVTFHVSKQCTRWTRFAPCSTALGRGLLPGVAMADTHHPARDGGDAEEAVRRALRRGHLALFSHLNMSKVVMPMAR